MAPLAAGGAGDRGALGGERPAEHDAGAAAGPAGAPLAQLPVRGRHRRGGGPGRPDRRGGALQVESS